MAEKEECIHIDQLEIISKTENGIVFDYYDNQEVHLIAKTENNTNRPEIYEKLKRIEGLQLFQIPVKRLDTPQSYCGYIAAKVSSRKYLNYRKFLKLLKLLLADIKLLAEHCIAINCFDMLLTHDKLNNFLGSRILPDHTLTLKRSLLSLEKYLREISKTNPKYKNLEKAYSKVYKKVQPFKISPKK